VQRDRRPDRGEVFQIVLVLQGEFDCFELARRAAGEVCDGAVLDLGAFAVILAKKVAGILALGYVLAWSGWWQINAA